MKRSETAMEESSETPKKSAREDDRRSILGHANGFRDPAIAVIAGDWVFAEAVERHSQCKFAMNFRGLSYSWRAVRAAMLAAGVELSNDVVVRTSWPKQGKDEAEAMSVPKGYFEEFYRAAVANDRARDLGEKFLIEEFIQDVSAFHRTAETSHRNKRNIEVKPTAHHLTHAALAVYTSPFEECVVVVADRQGATEDGELWLAIYHYDGKDFRILEQADATLSSLGGIYSIVTQLCGFSHIDGEEWKTMGLAAYGDRDERIYDYFRSRIRVNGLRVELDIKDYAEDWVEELERLTGPFRKRGDPGIIERSGPLARSFQDCFEDVMAELFTNLQRLGLSENVAYGGGMALNSSFNGKILSRSGFKRLHVPSAPGDVGNALGAALYEHHYVRGAPREPAVASPYLGSTISADEVERIVRLGGVKALLAKDDEDLCERIAAVLAEGKVVGWCQGKAEFGPRALGNRSILADPRPASMQDRINERVKFREEFRPLAPSILHEHGPKYFDPYEFSPYMERTLPFRPEVRPRVPAVVHRDGTGRLQSVTRDLNPLYHRLIERFHEKAGVPLVLNTSFNVMGKPIIHSASDAIAVFYTSGIDALALGRYILTK